MEKFLKSLVDDHGRRIRKLRVSLTDKCNLRCQYCMPVNQKFMNEDKYLTPDEYYEILKDLCSMGLEEVRLTGGEPLMRQSFVEIVEKISSLPLKKIGLTTNAVFLDQYLGNLKNAGVIHLNISMDSLQQDVFKKITYSNHFEKVLFNIRLAASSGFVVKLNMVVMKGINDHEIFDFVELSSDLGIEVRFLELMRIGYACKDQSDKFVSAQELIAKIKEKFELKHVLQPLDSTSFNYVTETGAQIGFIASESQPFCGQCSRWRLSADGFLRACLLKDDGKIIKNKNALERAAIYQELLGMKPYLRPLEVGHQMNAIGG